MLKRIKKLMAVVTTATLIFAGKPGVRMVQAGVVQEQVKQPLVEMAVSRSLAVRVDLPLLEVHEYASERSRVVARVARGTICEVETRAGDGWIRITAGEKSGYIRPQGAVTFMERAREWIDENVLVRRKVVECALQYVGGRYVYGGTDPNVGADCSGFTSYVMKQAAGLELPHNSAAQSGQGNNVDPNNLTEGDLVFYGGPGYIDHVALYIGNNQVVHASSARTGIKISDVNYRDPVKAVRLIGK